MSDLKRQQGAIIGWAIAIVLLVAAVSSYLVSMPSLNQSTITVGSVKTSLLSQSNIIKKTLLLCRIKHPNGTTGGTFDSALPVSVNDIISAECPGAPTGYKKLFGELTDINALAAIRGFGNWKLVNDAIGVRLQIVANDKTDSVTTKSVTKAISALPSGQSSWDSGTGTFTILIKS